MIWSQNHQLASKMIKKALGFPLKAAGDLRLCEMSKALVLEHSGAS